MDIAVSQQKAFWGPGELETRCVSVHQTIHGSTGSKYLEKDKTKKNTISSSYSQYKTKCINKDSTECINKDKTKCKQALSQLHHQTVNCVSSFDWFKIRFVLTQHPLCLHIDHAPLTHHSPGPAAPAPHTHRSNTDHDPTQLSSSAEAAAVPSKCSTVTSDWRLSMVSLNFEGVFADNDICALQHSHLDLR